MMATVRSDEIAEIDGGKFLHEPSMFAHLERGLKINPDKAAVISTHQDANYLSEFLDSHDVSPPIEGNHDCLMWTYRQLHNAAMRLATALLSRGIRTGSTLVTLIPQGVEWCLWVWTASIMRLTIAPLDFAALNQGREAELEHFMTQINPAIVIVPNAAGAQAVEKAIASAGVSRPFGVIVEDASLDHWVHFPSLARPEPADFTIDRESLLTTARTPDPDRIGLILFTSGTSSGKPKGCLLRVESTMYIIDVQQVGLEATTPHRCLVQSANFRAIAQIVLLWSWTTGGAVVLPGASASVERILTVAEDHRVTYMLFVPAFVHAFAAHLTLKSRDLSHLHTLTLGGDIITRVVLLKAQALVPFARVFPAHGMTEGGGLFQWPFLSMPLDTVPYFGETSPLGTISPGARARIWDTDSEQIVRRGEPGELHLHCVSMTRGYLGGINADSFYREDGRDWFKTGDLAIINPDGLVYILGRIKDVVKRAGVPITPAALESCLETYTGSQTTVVGISSPTFGQEPYAVLRTFGDKTEAEIKQHVVRSFGPDYALAGAKTLHELGMDDFPYNATGKIMKIDIVKAIEAS